MAIMPILSGCASGVGLGEHQCCASSGTEMGIQSVTHWRCDAVFSVLNNSLCVALAGSWVGI